MAFGVLIQVNIDREASKSGCTPEDVFAPAQRIKSTSTLQRRG